MQPTKRTSTPDEPDSAADEDPGAERTSIVHQLRKAVTGTGERFKEWQRALGGLVDGSLRPSVRAPSEVTPPWLTHDAERAPLQHHEEAALAELHPAPNRPPRTVLNRFFLTPEGRAALDRMLEHGTFRVHVPEEAALLTAAWLVRQGEWKRASTLIETLVPYFDRARFYPVPDTRPLPAGAGVHRATVGEAVDSVRATRKRDAFEKMREAMLVWTPLYDRAVALFLETVEGERPHVQRTTQGAHMRDSRGGLVVIGGWPCQRFAYDWRARARVLLNDYRVQRAVHTLCRKPDRPKENFARLRSYLEVCTADAAKLTPRDVGAIRRILATYSASHGAPDSVQRMATRAQQKYTSSLPLHSVVAGRVADALERHPRDAGLVDLDAVLARAAGGRPLPDAIARKAMRCLEAPLEQLVERRVLASTEVIATMLPRLAARARASTIADVPLRRVVEATSRAFRGERASFEQLPWIEALLPWIGSEAAEREAVRSALRQTVTTVLTTFPHQIIPNNFIRQLREVAARAEITIPLVDEILVDRWDGVFADAYLDAARVGARLLRESLYDHYYELPSTRIFALDPAGFAALCAERASRTGAPPQSGVVVEQAQILTTHNLAALFQEFGIDHSTSLAPLAERTFEWILWRLQRPQKDWRGQQTALKQTAAAWRQLVFLLSFLARERQTAFLDWSVERLELHPAEFQQRFEPVIAGLRASMAAERFDERGVHPASGGRRFLAFTAGTHWILPRAAPLRAPRA